MRNFEGSCTSLGYNVVDVPLGIASNQSGFAGAIEDQTYSSVNFNVFTFIPTPGSVIVNHIPAGTWTIGTTTVSMPATDFYGNTRVWPGAPGAVRQPLP